MVSERKPTQIYPNSAHNNDDDYHLVNSFAAGYQISRSHTLMALVYGRHSRKWKRV